MLLEVRPNASTRSSAWPGPGSSAGASSKRQLCRSALATRKSMRNAGYASAADRRTWVRPPEDLGAEHADQVHEDQVQHHRLGGGLADAYGPTTGVVAVV